MSDYSCLQCHWGRKKSQRGNVAAEGYAWCAWVYTSAEADDMPTWAHEVIMLHPSTQHGPADRAEDCAAYRGREK